MRVQTNPKNTWIKYRRKGAAVVLTCLVAASGCCLGGCGETSKTLAFSPPPAPSVAPVPGASLAYEVSRIDQPKLENDETQPLAGADYSWLTLGEYTLLRESVDAKSNQTVYSKLDYRYGFHEELFRVDENVFATYVAPDGKHYVTVESDAQSNRYSIVMHQTGQQEAKTLLTMEQKDWQNITYVQWSPDSSVYMLFFTQQTDAEPVQAPASGGTDGTLAATAVPVTFSVIVCSTDACLTPQAVPISKGENEYLENQACLSADGHCILLRKASWDGKRHDAHLVRISQDWSGVEAENVLDIAQTEAITFVGTDRLLFVQKANLLRVLDIWGQAQTEKVARLRVGPPDDLAFAFSPDGQALAYAGYDKNGNWNVYVFAVGSDGTATDQLVYKGGTDYLRSMAFSPEGGRLLLQTVRYRQTQVDNGQTSWPVILTFK